MQARQLSDPIPGLNLTESHDCPDHSHHYPAGSMSPEVVTSPRPGVVELRRRLRQAAEEAFDPLQLAIGREVTGEADA